jgi:hypothetical protein
MNNKFISPEFLASMNVIVTDEGDVFNVDNASIEDDGTLYLYCNGEDTLELEDSQLLDLENGVVRADLVTSRFFKLVEQEVIFVTESTSNT